jgi:hypothetical protein
LTGDVNGDNKVDIKDITLIAKAYGSFPGYPNWNPFCDFNNDGKIDARDFCLVCVNYGKTYP